MSVTTASDGSSLSEQERDAWLGLAWGAELGPAGFDRLLGLYGSASAVVQASDEDLVYGEAHLKSHQAALIRGLQTTLDLYRHEAEDLTAHGVSVFLSTDPGYPAVLRQLPHPPQVVCLRGKLLPIDDLALGIVGTRTPTREGADMAGKIAALATGDDFTIVSGLARGIDTAAHLGALQRQGRTLAVLGNGIRNVHPPENDELAERIEKQGAILSELPPHAEPTVPNLMARNRLISLLSRAVVVVECGTTGGSISTAQAALHQNRKLYTVQWPEPTDKQLGNAHLIAHGAEPLHTPQEIHAVCQALRAFRPVMPPPHAAPEHKPQMNLF